MAKGGGSTGTNWMDVQLQQEKMANENWQRAHSEAQARDRETIRKDAFSNSLNAGYAGARDRAYDMINKRGLDAGQYGDLVGDALEGVKSRIDPNDANPGQYFTDSVVEEALGKERDLTRTKYTNQVNQQFMPGFEDQYFGDASDDAFINDVLGTQKSNALGYVNRARDRGQLDTTGYNAALGRIGEMEASGRATANKLGDAVLQGNRTRLTDIANEAKAGAGAYELGQTFDPNVYGTRFSNTLGELNTSLEGDVRGALEGQKFFDVGDLISRAGAAQGSTNPRVEGADAIAARDKLRNTPRGVGAGGGTF